MTRPSAKPACPECGLRRSEVIDTRPTAAGDATYRRRRCLDCDHRFSTEERVAEYSRAKYPTTKPATS